MEPSEAQVEPRPLKSKDRKVTGVQVGSSSPDAGNAIAKVRQDLAEAQRSRGLLEAKLQSVTDEYNKLKVHTSLDAKCIRDLMREKSALPTGMRDRDEELKGKSKLLEDLHDETVSLTLQLNVTEEQIEKLRGENKDLVDRWMARMGEEADAMNNESKFT